MNVPDRRFQAALAIMQGLAASLEWHAGLMTHPEEMASDAVAMGDALLAELENRPDQLSRIRDLENALKDIYHAPTYARETVRQVLGIEDVPKPE